MCGYQGKDVGQCSTACWPLCYSGNLPFILLTATCNHRWKARYELPYHHRPPVTSSTPFNDFRTHFRQSIRYRLRSSNRSPMWLCLCHGTLNRSMAARHFPASVKEAFPTTYREEAGTQHHRLLFVSTNFKPVWYSKLFEWLVTRQLRDYLTSADLAPPLQSGLRLKLLSCIVRHPAGGRPW